jgi:hypothetical protein
MPTFAASNAIHEHLPAELLAQQVLGGLVVDRAYDVGDDPHGVRLLELSLDDAKRLALISASATPRGLAVS